ncbi:phytanoyl-CoA dioxygenase family protein [Streptomyces sp. HUAS MG47]|uniref:phytanoyl-CoA dioxygenase family protein n=1 Tax=Streptomyces solicamelliae TaxID=3231716 RepID=UPI003877F1FE
MLLSEEQVGTYREQGFLVLDSLFAPDEVEALCDAFRRDGEIPGEHRIVEEDGRAVRAVYASHQRQSEFAALVRHPRVLGPVRQLLDAEVYVYQFKINAKPAMGGGGWAWHQDFAAWRVADNLRAPRLVNVGVFLDDVTEFNGPVIFVPGSHRDGLVSSARRHDTARSEQHLDPDDIALRPSDMVSLAAQHGMTSPKGKAGSVVFFDPEIVHGSAPNMSPYDRRLLILTYNDVTNEPRPLGEPRPDYVVCRDTTPLQVLDGTPVLATAGEAV